MLRHTYWTLDLVGESIKRFLDEHGRMPTAYDYDECTYLPGSRYVQRNFGGLVKLRQDLDLDGPSDFTTGEFRSAVAAKMFANSKIYEEEFYLYLITIFPEIRVHEQKRLRPGNIASDFFIYTSDTSGFAIDLFYAENLKNVSKIITIKRKRYDHLTQIPIFFVIINDSIQQSDVNRMLENKKIQMLDHIQVYTELYFKENLQSLISNLATGKQGSEATLFTEVPIN